MLYLKNVYYLINSSLDCGHRSKIMWWGRRSGSGLHLRLNSDFFMTQSQEFQGPQDLGNVGLVGRRYPRRRLS